MHAPAHHLQGTKGGEQSLGDLGDPARFLLQQGSAGVGSDIDWQRLSLGPAEWAALVQELQAAEAAQQAQQGAAPQQDAAQHVKQEEGQQEAGGKASRNHSRFTLPWPAPAPSPEPHQEAIGSPAAGMAATPGTEASRRAFAGGLQPGRSPTPEGKAGGLQAAAAAGGQARQCKGRGKRLLSPVVSGAESMLVDGA